MLVLLTAAVLFAAEPAGVGITRYRAVLFSAQSYPKGSGLTPLDTPNTDVDRVAAVLRDQYGFEVDVVHEATRADIVGKLDGLKSAAESEAILVYYAGHGFYDREEDRAFWQPIGATRDSTLNWVGTEEIEGKVRAMKARHVVLISDSCFSGKLRGIDAAPVPTPDGAEAARKLASRPSRYLITSAGGDEPATDRGKDGMSVFAYYLVDALTHTSSPYVIPDTFAPEVRDRVGEHAAQVPTFGPWGKEFDGGGQLVLVNRAAACDPTAAVAERRAAADADWQRVLVALDGGAGSAPVQGWLDRWGGPLTVTACGKATAYTVDHTVEARALVKALAFGGPAPAPRPAPASGCGNGRPDAGEQCDFGRDNTPDGAHGGCTTACTLPWAPIPAGTYTLGTDEAERKAFFGYSADEPGPHAVTSAAFEVMTTEVTVAHQRRWGPRVDGDDRPWVNVGWEDARAYCAAVGGRLPTEAEWEVAARGHTRTPWSCGAEASCLDSVAWFTNNAGGAAHAVGTKAPNPFGLFDVHGNVWEWVADCYSSDRTHPGRVTNAQQVVMLRTCPYRVLRGGGFWSWPELLRTGDRVWDQPVFEVGNLGFRCVRGPAPQELVF